MMLLEQIKNNKRIFIQMTLMPMILITLLGFVFSKIYIEQVPFAIVDQDNTSLSRNIIRQFKIHPGLKIDYYPASEKELEKAIKDRRVYGGIVIPANFYKDVTEKKTPNVLVMLDGTNVIVATITQGYCSTILGTLNAGFQILSLESKGMLPYQTKTSITSFSYTERTLFDPTLSYLMYLIYMIFLYTVQTIYFGQFLVPYLMKKKEALLGSSDPLTAIPGFIKNSYVLPLMVIGTLCLSTYISLWIGHSLYGIGVRGGILKHTALMGVFLLGLTAIGIFATSIIKKMNYFLEAYYIFVLAIIMSSGIAWPQYMMPFGYAFCDQAFWPLFNMAYPFKALHLKDLTWLVLLPTILKGLLFAAFWGGLGTFIYWKKLKRIHQK